MTRQMIVTTPDPNYNGLTLGLQFNGGQTMYVEPPEVEDEQGNKKPGVNKYGWTFDQLLTALDRKSTRLNSSH